MPVQLHHYLNVKFALYALGGVLAVFGVSNAFVAVFVPARQEVAWQYEVTVSYCAQGKCAFSALLEVANTGSEVQEEVTVVITGLPAEIAPTPRLLNLDASYPRASDPRIASERSEDSVTLRLRGFMPGTLAQFRIAGYFTTEYLALAREPGIRVTASGRVVRGDPRGIALGRMFSRDARTLTPAPAAPISAERAASAPPIAKEPLP